MGNAFASRLTRRRFMHLAGAGSAAVLTSTLLAACGSDDEPAPTAAPGGQGASDATATPDTSSGTAPAEGSAKSGGNLTFVHQQIPSSLDANVWTATNAARIMRQIYDPLVWQPTGGEFVPGLAESWEVSDDGLTYTFTLREDVTFHDGTPFNADAVKATYDRMIDPASKSLQVSRLGPYDRSEVTDEYTVSVTLTEPFVVFLSNLSEVALAPASPTAVEKLGDDYPKHPVGAGPFRVREWPDETMLVLERFPDYKWGPAFVNNQGPAHLETITYKFVEETATRLLAIESGEADVMDAPPPQDVERIQASDQYWIDRFVVPGMPEIANINITREPTDDLAVRQAMLYAVDREGLAQLLFSGVYPAGQGPLTSGSWAYWDGVEDMYPYDPDKAAQILDDAGWKVGADGIREKDGKRLTLRHVTTAGGNTQKVAEYIQASVRELGFDYIVEAMAYEATAARFADNDYEVARLGYALIDPHDAFFLAYHSSQITGGGQFNRSRVEDPKIDQMIEDGVATADVAKRQEIYTELQRYIMEQALVLPAYETVLIHIGQAHVRDFKVDLLGRPYMVDVWIDK